MRIKTRCFLHSKTIISNSITNKKRRSIKTNNNITSKVAIRNRTSNSVNTTITLIAITIKAVSNNTATTTAISNMERTNTRIKCKTKININTNTNRIKSNNRTLCLDLVVDQINLILATKCTASSKTSNTEWITKCKFNGSSSGVPYIFPSWK